MPRPATGQTPVRNLRVPDEIWEPALANARAEGKTITEVITAALKRYNVAAKRRQDAIEFAVAPERLAPDMKLTPGEWCRAYGVRVLDPDGWRAEGAPEWVEPITLVEFERLAGKSTTDAASPGWEGVSRDARLCEADAAEQEPTP